jgi:hypothetical protein
MSRDVTADTILSRETGEETMTDLRQAAVALLRELLGYEWFEEWTPDDITRVEAAFKAQRVEECEAIRKHQDTFPTADVCADHKAWLDARARALKG